MGKKNLKVYGFVFARGGSKGVHKKNIKELDGKPLIHYSIEACLGSNLIDRVIVSTENDEIAQKALEAGAEVPFLRPLELAMDDSPEWLSWQHAITTLNKMGQEFDIFVSVPTTSPLRWTKDIDRCIKKLMDNDKTDAVITVSKARRHPSFNMVFLEKNGVAKIALKDPNAIYRRQDAPAIYDITTVAYAVRPKFILTKSSLFKGRVKAIVIPEERSLDIDTELDFKIAELLMKDSK